MVGDAGAVTIDFRAMRVTQIECLTRHNTTCIFCASAEARAQAGIRRPGQATRASWRYSSSDLAGSRVQRV